MLPFLGFVYLQFVALTSRIRVVSRSEESILALRERRPVIFTHWFEHITYLMYYFGARHLAILMTPQGKTDALTKLSQWMGLKTAIGSLEGGGRHALLTLLESLRAGQPVVLSADGSRGPERRCKAGCFILAQETGLPIVPVSWKAAFQIKIRRRNGCLEIPLPFNRIEIRLGAPITVDKHYQFAELDPAKTQLAATLDRLSR